MYIYINIEMIGEQLSESISLILAIIAVLIGIAIYTGFFGIFSSNEYQQCLGIYDRLSSVLDSCSSSSNFNYFFTQNENDCVIRYYNSASLDKPCSNNCLVLYKVKGMKMVVDKMEKYDNVMVTFEDQKVIDFSEIFDSIINIKYSQDNKVN